MNTFTRQLGTAIATLAAAGMLLPAPFAAASTKGRKNTTLGLGAAAAYELLNGKTTNGVLLGAGAAYAYKKYEDEKKAEERDRRATTYRTRTTTTTTSRSRYGGASANAKGIFTGVISHDTDYVHRQLKVDANGRERRVDVPKDTPVYLEGGISSVHDLRKGDRVRITEVQTGDDRYRATRIDVIDAYGVNDGTPAVNTYSGVGIIQGIADDNRSFDMQVGDNIRRVNTGDSRFNGFQSVRELRVGDRVRVKGDLDGRDVLASSISLLD